MDNIYRLENILLSLAYLFEYLIVEYFIIFILESIYGFKIIEYLDIKNTKYKLRNSDWLLNKIQLNLTIKPKYRPLDHFGWNT